jgi:hypothetical protein
MRSRRLSLQWQEARFERRFDQPCQQGSRHSLRSPRAYPEALRITVRSPSDDDLLLGSLGVEAPPSSRRSATVLTETLRVSLTLDGKARAVSTGDDARDARPEAHAVDAGWDLELVADASVGSAEVWAALEQAEASC